MKNGMSRRDMLRALPAFTVLPAALVQGQTNRPTIPARSFNHMTLSVSDPKRSLEFYQGLFGMPVQARQGATTLLRVGRGPQFVALTPAGAGVRPHINHFCLTVDDFDAERIFGVLKDYGLKPRGDAGGDPPPLTYYVIMRMPDRGGAPGGTAELYFSDPDGLLIQLQDARYCGGAGLLGERC